MKKLLIALGIVFGLLVVAALVIPMVVDVDKYRPQIVTAANQQISGELSLGKLSLSLWGQVRVQVGGVELKDASGNSLISVSDAYFHIPFSSIFSGEPLLTFKMEKPTVNVVKNKNGKINLLTLVKPTVPTATTTPSAPGTPPSSAPADHGPTTQIPAFAARARIGVEMDNANLSYKDETTGMSSKVSDLNLILKDISLSHPTDIEVSAQIDTEMNSGGKTISVHGPVKLTGTGVPQLGGGTIQNLSMRMNLDLDALEVRIPGTFEKSKSVPMHATLALSGNSQEASIDKLDAVFYNAEISASGKVTNIGSAPAVDMKISSNEIDLKPWSAIIPMLKDYDLTGSAKLEADAKGEASKLGYHAHFEIKKLTAKAPNLKAQPEFGVILDVVTDQIDNLVFTMHAPANDLEVKGKLTSFTAPHGEFNVTSNSLDLDQLIDFPKPAPAAKGAPAGSSGAAPGGAKAPPADLDAMLAPLRTNKMLAESSIVINANLKMVKAENVKLTDLSGKMYFKNLVAGLDNFSVKVWDGSIKSTMAAQLQPNPPRYRFNVAVSGLDLSQAVESQMNFFKNTVSGRANFSMTGEGSSFNTLPAEKNLVAKGSFKVTDANFTTIDVGKMVTDALNKSIAQVGDKVSALKGKIIKGVPAGSSKYDLMSSDFSISGGHFVAPNFVAKAAPNKGIDLKGDTEVGMIDYSLKTSWEVTDTYNVTGAKDLSVNISGIQVDHILSEKGAPVKFPIQAGCTILQPCYSYTQVFEYLSKVALGNVAGSAKSQAVQKLLPSNTPPAVGNALKKFFH